MAYIKNIKHEEAQNLSSLIPVLPGQIVSKTLAQNSIYGEEDCKWLLTVVFPI